MSDTTPRYFSGYTPVSDEQIEREMREATEAGEIPVPVDRAPDPLAGLASRAAVREMFGLPPTVNEVNMKRAEAGLPPLAHVDEGNGEAIRRRVAVLTETLRSVVPPDEMRPIAVMLVGLQEAHRVRLFEVATKARAEGAAEEREACAQVAEAEITDDMHPQDQCREIGTATRIAAAIRARGAR